MFEKKPKIIDLNIIGHIIEEQKEPVKINNNNKSKKSIYKDKLVKKEIHKKLDDEILWI